MATSTITNTLTDLNGDPVAGVTVIARLKPGAAFRVTEGTEIAPQDETTTDNDGIWSLALERQTNIDPSDTYYEIEERIPDAKGGPKFHSIQVGASNQTLQAARVDVLPADVAATYLTQAAGDALYASASSLGTYAAAQLALATLNRQVFS